MLMMGGGATLQPLPGKHVPLLWGIHWQFTDCCCLCIGGQRCHAVVSTETGTTLGNFMTLVDIVNTGGSFFFGNVKEMLLEPFFLMALHKTISISRMHVTHIGNWDTLSSSKMHMCNLSWQLNDPNWHLPHLLAVFRKLCPYKKAQAEHNTGNLVRKRKMMSSSKWKLNYVWIKWVHLGMTVRGWQWLWLPPIKICKATLCLGKRGPYIVWHGCGMQFEKFYSLIHSDSVVWCGLHLRLVK